MPINNSYSQTPKRIFTNKPFIKGMNYTNADLEPFVCRAVSNLELESSNSATRLRQGIHNKVIGNHDEIVYKFYNKFICFTHVVNENLYNNDITLPLKYSTFGIRVLNNNYNEIPFWNRIITNNTILEWNGNLSITGGESGITITDNMHIIALQMNEGDIPHCINNEDFSFTFLGIIMTNTTINYKGFLKIYHHKLANQIIIEMINPEQVDNETVNEYGLNMLSNAPSIYKDYVKFTEHDFYNDYMGVGSSKEVKNTIDMLTVAMYDAAVNPAPYTNTSSANMIKGVNANNPTQQIVYIRPYYAIPGGHYGAIIKATSKMGSEVYYNFNSHVFGLSNKTKQIVKETKTIDMPIYVSGRSVDSRSYTGVLSEYDLTITKCIMPSFKLLATNIAQPISYSELPPEEERSSGVYVYNVGFGKIAYSIDVNKYMIPNYTNNTVTDNSVAIANTNIVPTSRTEIRLNKCSNTYVQVIADWECNQYCKFSVQNGIVTMNSNCNNYYTFEVMYDDLDADDNFITPIKSIMCAHFKTTIFVYSYFDGITYNTNFTLSNIDDSLLVGVINPSVTPVGADQFIFERVTSNPVIDIVSADEPNIILSNGETMYCKRYTISTQINYECEDEDIIEWLLPDTYKIHIGHNDSSVKTNIDYVYVQQRCDLGDEEYTDSYLIDRSYVELQNIELPSFTFTFRASVSYGSYPQHFSPTFNISTDNNYSGATLANLDFSTNIGVEAANETDDSDKSLNYVITQSIDCKQSGITKISNSIKLSSYNRTYDYDTDFTSLGEPEILDIINYGYADTDAIAPINLYTSKEAAHISKNYVHIVQDTNNNRAFSIPVYTAAFSSIIGSTISVRLFPIIDIHISDDQAQYIEYKEANVIEQALYTIRTDIDSIVDVSEIINDKFKTTALRMCNHLGHTVVWGDETSTNSLYYSAYGNPSYFPSNYIITLDNPIVYAYPHRSNLVVFTTDDVYLLYGGNVPSTTSTDGTEVAFSQKLIQANTRLGKDHINTVKTVGKDLFFINNNNKGYLLKSNKYVNDDSDVYLVKLTTQIDDLLDDPYSFARERFSKWDTTTLDIPNATFNVKQMDIYSVIINDLPINYFTTLVYDLSTTNNLNIIDGDTFDIDGVRYRLADIDTPEITNGKNERLGTLAKNVLTSLITNNYGAKLRIYDSGDVDNYNRHIAYALIQTDEEFEDSDFININATMLYNGLAYFFDENHDKYNLLLPLSQKSYIYAKLQKLGVYNSYEYSETIFNMIDYNTSPANFITNLRYWIPDTSQLYVYANNSYIYIFQPIHLDFMKSITLIYKYSIDNKIYTMYDIIGYINPTDILSDNNLMGFSILNINDSDNYYPSLLSFTNNKYDVNELIYTANNQNLGDYNLTELSKTFIINAYFDSGNQSISLMNDKLFREIKLSLGSLPDSLLSMNYQIDLYVDGKLVIPNQQGSCKDHIHHIPVNTHYKGSIENVSGFQKVTFFAPARGRIPRIVFSINCESDINILEYAIVYMQLNAK